MYGLVAFGEPRKLTDAMKELERFNVGKVLKFGTVALMIAGFQCHIGYIVLMAPFEQTPELKQFLGNHCIYNVFLSFTWGEG